jgi:hypothetical protein
VSDAETSAYLLMVGGLIWILVGVIGLRKQSPDNDAAEQSTTDDGNSSDRAES